MALEINDLVNQHKVNDNLNNEIGTRSFGSGTLDDCQCVNVLNCTRTRQLQKQLSGLSSFHPQRQKGVSYIRSLICDKQNKRVRCCGQISSVTQTTNTRQQTRPISENEKVCKLNFTDKYSIKC